MLKGDVGWPGTLTWLQILIAVALFLLGVQYVLGIEVNMYLSPPYNSSNPLFSLHYSVGILCVAFGLAILAVAVLTRARVVILTTALAFFSTLGAGQAGREFAFSSTPDELLSVEMAVGFLVAFAAYFLAALALRNSRGPANLQT